MSVPPQIDPNRIGDLVQLSKALAQITPQTDPVREQILATLAQLGGLSVEEDALLFQGDKFILPANLEGNIDGAIKYLRDYKEQQETKYEFSRTFKYRPYDGANAFQLALKEIFGTTGVGVTKTFFGIKIPPEMLTIDIGYNQHTQIPWGEVTYSPLDATFYLSATRDKEHGLLFQLAVEAPRRYRKHVDAVFELVERKLVQASIYKGKAINGAEQPGFLNLNGVDPAKVVYSNETLIQLQANVWTALQHSHELRRLGQSLNRKVLVEGPYGTGKSLAGYLTAQIAVTNGWTYILVRTDDDLFEALRTARLYAPAVVFFEDIDIIAGGGTSDEISKVLDALDGVQTKGAEVVAVFTTNHVNKIQKGVMRPGRIDAVVHIGKLDQSGVETLIRTVIPEEMLADDVEWESVFTAYDGFLPAFVSEAASRAVRYTLARNEGRTGTIITEDLVFAAESLRPQLELMEGAKEGADAPSLDRLLPQKFAEVLDGRLGAVTLVDRNGNPVRGGEHLSVVKD